MERFLVPRLHQHFQGRAQVNCLQIQPDDENEAIHLRALGHACEVVTTDAGVFSSYPWVQTPLTADPFSLPFTDGRFDFILTGALSLIAPNSTMRRRALQEWGRVCAPGGALLFSIGNRPCPLDLAGPRKRLHTPWDRALPTLEELEGALADVGGFVRTRRLSLNQHFGFSSVPKGLAPCKEAVQRYLAWASNPEKMGRYASALNPVLMLWAEKAALTDSRS